MKTYILYNPLSGNGSGAEKLEELKEMYKDNSPEIHNVLEVKDMKGLLASFDRDSLVIICGGDGTLNHFVNDTDEGDLRFPVYFYPAGTGNDFLRDINLNETDKPVDITEYLKDLPTVTIDGKTSKFINGIGYGIDGYCCEVGDKMRGEGKKKIDYAGIAVKGLLFHYKNSVATVNVDGKEHKIKNAWLAPCMHGRYYGGGMLAAPGQNRLAKDKKVSVMIMHGASRLATLILFPSIFKGEHVNNKKHVSLFTGKDVTVSFDEPKAVQIDGETVPNVSSYTAHAHR